MFRYIFRLPWLLLRACRKFVRWVMIGGDLAPRVAALERHIARIDMRHSRLVHQEAEPGKRGPAHMPDLSLSPEVYPYLNEFPWPGVTTPEEAKKE